MPRYRIHLTSTERAILTEWVKTGKRKAQYIQYCHILLNSDESEGRKALATSELVHLFHITSKTVERVRRAFCESGMQVFETKLRKTRSDKKLDARVEAHLIALVCQSPPDEAPRWKLQMLADRLVAMEVVESISKMSVCNLLKKTNLNLSTRSNM